MKKIFKNFELLQKASRLSVTFGLFVFAFSSSFASQECKFALMRLLGNVPEHQIQHFIRNKSEVDLTGLDVEVATQAITEAIEEMKRDFNGEIDRYLEWRKQSGEQTSIRIEQLINAYIPSLKRSYQFVLENGDALRIDTWDELHYTSAGESSSKWKIDISGILVPAHKKNPETYPTIHVRESSDGRQLQLEFEVVIIDWGPSPEARNTFLIDLQINRETGEILGKMKQPVDTPQAILSTAGVINRYEIAVAGSESSVAFVKSDPNDPSSLFVREGYSSFSR